MYCDGSNHLGLWSNQATIRPPLTAGPVGSPDPAPPRPLAAVGHALLVSLLSSAVLFLLPWAAGRCQSYNEIPFGVGGGVSASAAHDPNMDYHVMRWD